MKQPSDQSGSSGCFLMLWKPDSACLSSYSYSTTNTDCSLKTGCWECEFLLSSLTSGVYRFYGSSWNENLLYSTNIAQSDDEHAKLIMFTVNHLQSLGALSSLYVLNL